MNTTHTEPTTAKLKHNVGEILKTIGDTLVRFACRWADEHEYEDIGAYQAVLTTQLDRQPLGYIVRMTKRPFGVVVRVDGWDVKISCLLRGNSVALKWKAVRHGS